MDDLWAFVAVVSVEGTTTLSTLILQIEGSRPRTSGGARRGQSLELGVKDLRGCSAAKASHKSTAQPFSPDL